MKKAARAAPPSIGAAVMAGANASEVADEAADEAAPAADEAADPAAPVALVAASLAEAAAEPAASEADAIAPEALADASEADAAREETAADALAAASEAEPEREPTPPATAPAMLYMVVEPMVEVATALPPEEMVVTTASVVNGTLEPATAPVAVVATAAGAPPEVTPAAVQDVSSFDRLYFGASSLTCAHRVAVGLDSTEHIFTASLNSAVAQTVTEAWVAAQAGEVSWTSAAEGRGNAEHVGDAHLTAGWDPK